MESEEAWVVLWAAGDGQALLGFGWQPCTEKHLYRQLPGEGSPTRPLSPVARLLNSAELCVLGTQEKEREKPARKCNSSGLRPTAAGAAGPGRGWQP